MLAPRQTPVRVAVVMVLIAFAHDASSEAPAYQLVDNFFKLPAGRKIGSTAGITIGRSKRSRGDSRTSMVKVAVSCS